MRIVRRLDARGEVVERSREIEERRLWQGADVVVVKTEQTRKSWVLVVLMRRKSGFDGGRNVGNALRRETASNRGGSIFGLRSCQFFQLLSPLTGCLNCLSFLKTGEMQSGVRDEARMMDEDGWNGNGWVRGYDVDLVRGLF